MLTLGDESGAVQLKRVSVEHKVAVVSETLAQLLSSPHGLRPHEGLSRSGGDFEVHSDNATFMPRESYSRLSALGWSKHQCDGLLGCERLPVTLGECVGVQGLHA